MLCVVDFGCLLYVFRSRAQVLFLWLAVSVLIVDSGVLILMVIVSVWCGFTARVWLVLCCAVVWAGMFVLTCCWVGFIWCTRLIFAMSALCFVLRCCLYC